jgi:hypothetical protein
MAVEIIINLNVKWSGSDIIVTLPEPSLPPINNTTVKVFENWEATVESGGIIELQDGFTYVIPNYSTAIITKDLTISCNGKATIIFGKDYYNQWKDDSEDRFIFDLGIWNNKIRIENVNIFTGNTIDEVQPFFRTLFWNRNAPNQTGTIELINSETNMELGLLYSGSQTEYLTVRAENINFQGVMWQELKAPNGGGLLSIMRNCNLKMIDPITHFESKIKLIQNEISSSVSFDLIQNQFNQVGNSCNIVYADNMTFVLTKTGNKGFSHEIREIGQVGKKYNVISMQSEFGTGITSNTFELQAGDIVEMNGTKYTINRKDRVDGNAFERSGYACEYNFEHQIPFGEAEIIVKKSRGQEFIGKELNGYLIFKYNLNFITWSDKEPNMQQILLSNPFGVLSYNHVEITVDWENLVHDGFYRQSSSNVGFSNGYRLVNCTGLKDQFSPPIK